MIHEGVARLIHLSCEGWLRLLCAKRLVLMRAQDVLASFPNLLLEREGNDKTNVTFERD